MKIMDFFINSAWKFKAIKRAKELNSLKKRNKELEESRDKAKLKNEKLSIKYNESQKRIKELKNELKKN